MRIYTIGFGTTQPAPFVCSPDQLGSGGFGGGGFGGPRTFGGFGGVGGDRVQQIDENTLTQVATVTGGKYFAAKDAKQLTDVLLNLPSAIVLQRKHVEISVWFALVGALFVLSAVSLAQWWNRSGPLPSMRPARAPSG